MSNRIHENYDKKSTFTKVVTAPGTTILTLVATYTACMRSGANVQTTFAATTLAVAAKVGLDCYLNPDLLQGSDK